MTARDRNTPLPALVALFACVLACALAGCGGSQQSAQSIVDETFHSPKQIDSGQLSLSFHLQGSGLSSLSRPVSVQVAGPFESLGDGRLPRFALGLDLATGGQALHAGAVSAAGKVFVQLQGISFQAPPSTVAALQQSYAQSSRRAASQRPSTFSSLGVDPGAWLEHPVKAGTSMVGGARTIHLVAALNLARFLADASRLSGAGGTLGLSGATAAPGLLSAQQSQALVKSLSAARVDLYSGADDHLLRRLVVHASVLTSASARSVLGGLRSATLTLTLQLANLNERQRISAPSNARPISQLISVLQQTGLAGGSSSSAGALSGLLGEAASSGGEGSGSASPPSSPRATASPAYMRCVQSAGQQVSALQKCAALLTGH
ncbi:MAG TPA: hypothetical protein VGF15_06195 [Solirubrobacteraceae bacterium]